MSRYRRRRYLSVANVPPDPTLVAEAHDAVLGAAYARLRRAAGHDVEVPAVPERAEAVVLADALARGEDVSAAGIEMRRAELLALLTLHRNEPSDG